VPRNSGLEDSIPLGLKNRTANAHENSNGTAYVAATGRCVVAANFLFIPTALFVTIAFRRNGDVLSVLSRSSISGFTIKVLIRILSCHSATIKQCFEEAMFLNHQ
jgi:hypothetical protein